MEAPLPAARTATRRHAYGLKIMTRFALFPALMLFSLAANAEYPPEPVPDAPPPPPMPRPDVVPPPPSGVGEEEELQPEVKITKRGTTFTM